MSKASLLPHHILNPNTGFKGLWHLCDEASCVAGNYILTGARTHIQTNLAAINGLIYFIYWTPEPCSEPELFICLFQVIFILTPHGRLLPAATKSWLLIPRSL